MIRPKTSSMKRLGRAMKYQYIKLLRSPGGARKVAMGFAIGFATEFLVIASFGLIYIFFLPLVWVARGSLPAAIIGHIIGKLTFLPIPMLVTGKWLGGKLLPFRIHLPDWFPKWMEVFLNFHLKTLVGMALISTILGIISYMVAYYMYEANRKRRLRRLATRKVAQVQDNGQ